MGISGGALALGFLDDIVDPVEFRLDGSRDTLRPFLAIGDAGHGADRDAKLAGDAREDPFAELNPFKADNRDSRGTLRRGQKFCPREHAQVYTRTYIVSTRKIKPVLSPGSRPGWSEKIALLRRDLGITQVTLAQRLQIKQASVSRWETGEAKPTASNFMALAEMAPAGELREFFHSLAERAAGVKIDRGDQPVGKKGPRPVPSEGVARIPLLKDSAAAGSPRQLDERAISIYIEFPAQWCPKAQHCIAIKVTGDSMSPTLEEGFIVFIDLSQKDPKRLVNEMVAARDGEGGVTIKWLRKVGNYFMLVPQHTSQRHQPQMIETDDDWAIIGRVIKWVGEPPKSRGRK